MTEAAFLHGEAVLAGQLLKLVGGLALLALVFYVAWAAVGRGRRN
jgi:hypothetical protein